MRYCSRTIHKISKYTTASSTYPLLCPLHAAGWKMQGALPDASKPTATFLQPASVACHSDALTEWIG